MTAAIGPGIDQILVAASPGDAITNLALGTRRLLRQVGASEIYAHYIAPELAAEVRPLSTYPTRRTPDIPMIFHASIGQPEVHRFLTTRAEPLVLVYHNVTPGSYFEPFDPAFAEMLMLGRAEVELLRPRVARALADSHFNARELETMGYHHVRVVPPVVDIRRLSRVEPRASTMAHLATFNGPIVLSVGQLMPHKRPDFLVEMMHVAETYLGLRGYMMFVGHQRLESYTRAVREQVQELSLSGVHFVGAVDEADLAAMYRSADVVVTASEHEGFCLPLLEAMTFEKPIVARACAAVPETVGPGAVLLPAYEGPVLFAEAVAEVLAKQTTHDAVLAGGRRRLAELERCPPDAAIVETLLELV